MTTFHANRIDSFSGKHVLVIGDLILDVYLKGRSTRLSPEAPVPVVDVDEKKSVLGGAANVACNLRALGAQVTLISVVGNDREGEEVLRLLAEIGVATDTIVREAGRSTLVKTRVVAGTQVITRFDSGTCSPVNRSSQNSLTDTIVSHYLSCDAVVLSDYDKGILTSKLIETLRDLQNRFPKFLAVDSKRLQFFSSLHPTLVKPNYDEAVKLVGLRANPELRSLQVANIGKRLADITNAQFVALTLDCDGSTIFEHGTQVYRCKAPIIPAPQVSGAGDTYLSAFVLAYLSCGEISYSADVATAAATLVVSKMDTASCSNIELKVHLHGSNKLIASAVDLHALCQWYRTQGKRIVFTNGCFDILHSGHIAYLRSARELGDVLIAGINTDESIKRLKGPQRPVNPLDDRVRVLSGLSSVDHIVSFGSALDDTPIPVIRIVRPDIFVKGGDYTLDTLPEAKTVEDCGGKIVFIPHVPDRSTTNILQRIHAQAPKKIALSS